MAGVHTLRCIIYIRKEANILDEANLTQDMKKRTCTSAHFRCVAVIRSQRMGAHCHARCSAPHPCSSHTLASAAFTYSGLVHTKATVYIQALAKLGGVTITLFILPTSAILQPNRLCPHVLVACSSLSFHSHPPFHLSASPP